MAVLAVLNGKWKTEVDVGGGREGVKKFVEGKEGNNDEMGGKAEEDEMNDKRELTFFSPLGYRLL